MYKSKNETKMKSKHDCTILSFRLLFQEKKEEKKTCSPVVPPLPNGADRHERVLRRPRLRVVRVVPEHVRGGVHEPGEVQHDAVAQRAGNPESVPEVLPPPVLAHQPGKDEAHEQREPGVKSVLEHHDRVRLQVGEVKGAPGLDHLRADERGCVRARFAVG